MRLNGIIKSIILNFYIQNKFLTSASKRLNKKFSTVLVYNGRGIRIIFLKRFYISPSVKGRERVTIKQIKNEGNSVVTEFEI